MLLMAESPDARDELPRISIDSLHDWCRIKDNYVDAAIGVLDRKLAEHDLTHQRHIFVQHLMQFLNSTFETTKPNLRVNGRNFEDCNEGQREDEQFDEALDRRVWSLSDQRRRWDLEIAKKRRTAPQEVEYLMCDLIARQREHDDAAAPQDVPHMDIDFEDRDDDKLVEGVQHETLLLLRELNKHLPEQLERSQRVKQVDKEIRTLKL